MEARLLGRPCVRGSPLHGLSEVTAVGVRVINHSAAVETKGLRLSQAGESGANKIRTRAEGTAPLCALVAASSGLQAEVQKLKKWMKIQELKAIQAREGFWEAFVVFSEFRRPEEHAVGVGTAGGNGQMVERTALHGSRATLQGLQGCSVHESVRGPRPGPHVHPNPAHLLCCQPLAAKPGQKNAPDLGTRVIPWGDGASITCLPSRRGRTESLSFRGEETLRSHNLRGFVVRCFSSYG